MSDVINRFAVSGFTYACHPYPRLDPKPTLIVDYDIPAPLACDIQLENDGVLLAGRFLGQLALQQRRVDGEWHQTQPVGQHLVL